MTSTNAISGNDNQFESISGNVNFIYSQSAQIKPNPSSTVPFEQDPDFVDRDILEEVDRKCSEPGSRVALVGLGGVGKSQLAIEYSHRIRKRFPQTWVFWVHASNAARFEEGYRMIAKKIRLPGRNEQTADILQLVRNWLCDEANGRWLMILDNANDPSLFSDPRKGGLKSDIGALVGRAKSLSAFLPQSPTGSILVTSRTKEAAFRLAANSIIEVEPMDENRALLLFEKNSADGFDRDDAIELVRALDYMPLAISQAAAYIRQKIHRTTVAKYLDVYRKSDRNRANLLNRDAGYLRRNSYASNSIITTWQISFEYIRGSRPSAARLLSLMSFFDRQGIPEFLLHQYDDTDGSDIDLKDETDEDLGEDNGMGFEDDLSTLTSYSLIKKNVKGDQFEMHRLVQFSVRNWLELNGELEKWKKNYIKIILAAFPNGDYKNWKICNVLFPHAEAVLAHRPAEGKYLIYWSEVLHKAGQYAATQGNYLTAEELNRRALEGREKALGKEHPDTLTSFINLAVVLQDQGKYEAAEEMHRRVLEGREKVLGKEHPDTLTSFNNLAVVLQDQGKYEAAEEMHRRALAGYQKVWGADHTSTLNTAKNLGILYQNQSKLAEAESMYQRALSGREKAFGIDHPSTLDAISSLGSLFSDQGRMTEAEKQFQQALTGYEKVLGFDHPSTIDTLNQLGNLYKKGSNLESSEIFLRRAVIGYTRSLGVEHSSTKDASRNLAYVRNLRSTTSEENMVLDSDSDASSIESYLEDTSLAPSSVTSVSAILPEAEIKKFITGLAQLLQNDDVIRGTVWKALERSRNELKFNRPKIVRNFSRLLRQYAKELNQNSTDSMEKISAKFVRNKSHPIAIAVFETLQPAEKLQNQTEILANRPVEKLTLDRFLNASENIKAEIRSRTSKGEEENNSSDESEPSHIDEIQISHSIELVETFLMSGMPFTNLKQRFQRFVDRRTLIEMPHDDAVRDPPQRDFSSNLSYSEDGKIQVRWQCRCGHQFQETMVEYEAGVAEEFVRHMHWDGPPDIQGLPFQWPWLNAISGFLRMFLRQRDPSLRLHEGWWKARQGFMYNPQHEAQRQPSTAHRDEVAAADAIPECQTHFVCICIRHMSRANYLHHVRANQKIPPVDETDPTDQDMFTDIQSRYYYVRPWWKRLLFCARLSSVQYYEFSLFYNPENEVNIEEDWKDRFPENPPEGEWHYVPHKRDRTPYLYDRTLFHYVQNPDHAPKGAYFWNRIPKKLRDEMSCQDDPERPGWGLVMKEEWHQTAFLICWVPIVVIGAVGSGLYAFYARKSVAVGCTIFAGILALIVWFYNLAQGYAKQGGLL